MPAQPENTAQTAESDRLAEALDRYAAETGAAFSVAVHDASTQQSWTYHADGQYLEASLVKVPILLTLLRQATEEGRELTLEEEELAVMMIEYSDNDATTQLYHTLGGAPELERTYTLLGLSHTEAAEIWGANETDAEDQLRIARAVAGGVDWIDAPLMDFAVELMANVESTQSWGISAGIAEPEAQIALKNGWLQDDDLSWNVGSSGFIRTAGSDYSMVILTAGTSTLDEGIGVVEGVARILNSFGKPFENAG